MIVVERVRGLGLLRRGKPAAVKASS